MSGKKFFNENKGIIIIILLGFLLRCLFVLFGAKAFFGRENIFTDGDTGTWMLSIQNLLEHGIYSMRLDHEYGYFGRTPGYSFFIGIFYLLTGKDWNAAFPIIGWTQLFLDTFAIFVMYRIGMKIFRNDKLSSLILSFLYATYPFIITWNPVVYSESLSIFLLIVGFYFLVSDDIRFHSGWLGIFLSLSVLTRPQVLILLPVVGVFILFKYRKNVNLLVKHTLYYGLTVLIVYGSWPIRNYLNYDKIQFTHDLRSFDVWGPDALAFREYIYTVKAEWEPQFSALVKNERVIFPEIAYRTPDDSLKLEQAVTLSQNCGSGFSYWSKYWKEPITGENCNDEIVRLFNELQDNQKKYNPVNVYLWVPLQNLAKSLFKIKLYNTESLARKIGSLLFLYRTLLIFLGIVGILYLIKSNDSEIGIFYVILGYFVLLYFLLCFGTGPNFRNIEMRYFLPADVLLLIPAAVPLKNVLLHITKKKFKN